MFNARSICNKLPDLQLLIDCDCYDIVAITESWLNARSCITNSMLDVSNRYSIFRSDRDSLGGGVCLLVSKKLKCINVPVIMDGNLCELVCVDIHSSYAVTRFILCYRPPRCNQLNMFGNNKIIRAIERLLEVTHSVVILGDLNLPDVNWEVSSYDIDQIQGLYLKLILENGFKQFVSQPTRGNNILDLIFSNDPFLMSEVIVSTPFSTSDHNSVWFSIFLPESNFNNSPLQFKRNFDACDWDIIRSEFASIDWDLLLLNCLSANELWNVFTYEFYKVIDRHCPAFAVKHKSTKTLYPYHIRKLIKKKFSLAKI